MAWNAPREARFPFRPAHEVEAAQRRRIRAVVSHAASEVPYYRDTFRRLGLDPAQLRTASDLARLPLIERSDVQQRPEYFRSRAWPLAACVPLHSAGSTGAPLTFYRDPRSFAEEAAQRERFLSLVGRLAGRRFRYREAAILPPDSSVAEIVRAGRRHTASPPGLRVQRRSFSMWRAPQEVAVELDRYRPDVITSYGSYLEALFTHLLADEADHHLPRVVFFGADALSEPLRNSIAGDLGIEVLSTYKAIETPGVGFECELHRGYHLNVDLCPVRLIGPDGAPVASGESGEVVVSNLVNRGTILLNYRLGDLAAMRPDSCPCGRTLPVLSYLQGHAVPWLDLGRGRTIHPQAVRAPIRRERDLRRYQIVQEGRRQFLMRAVVAPECDREIAARRFGALLRDSLGGDVAVRVEFVEDLARDPSGKVRTVVPLSADPLQRAHPPQA